jgi:hypothetical protein
MFMMFKVKHSPSEKPGHERLVRTYNLFFFTGYAICLVLAFMDNTDLIKLIVP